MQADNQEEDRKSEFPLTTQESTNTKSRWSICMIKVKIMKKKNQTGQ